MNTTLNNRGEQWVHEGGLPPVQLSTATVTRALKVAGWQQEPSSTPAQKAARILTTRTRVRRSRNSRIHHHQQNGRQIILFSGIARDTLIYAGGDQSVHGRALNTTLNGGYQYVHKDGLALNTVINEGLAGC